MTALVRMRLVAFIRSGRVLAPLMCVLVVLLVIYGGGAAQVGEAYGFSSAVLFPILAWQTKLLLDVEPDTQRHLAIVAVGSRHREWFAGIVAAALAALAGSAFTIGVPWLVGGVTGPQRPDDPPFAAGFVAGVWAVFALIPPALALGALASRAVTRDTARGLMVLVGGSIAAYPLGITSSPVWWLVPPVLRVGRSAVHGLAGATMAGYTVHALLWTAVALAGYSWLRRARS